MKLTSSNPLVESKLRQLVRERIARLLRQENVDSEMEKDKKQNPRPPSAHQPPEPLPKDISQDKTKDADNVMSKTKMVDKPTEKPKDVNDPTATPVDMNQLKNERIARFIQAVANTSKQDLQFIINDTAPDTKAKTIKLFLKLIGVSPNDVSALITSADQSKAAGKDTPASPPVDSNA